jgi:hypothetical protein
MAYDDSRVTKLRFVLRRLFLLVGHVQIGETATPACKLADVPVGFAVERASRGFGIARIRVRWPLR